MHITASTVSLNVEQVTTSADFIISHFDFTETMRVGDDVVSVTRPDAGLYIVYLRTGLESFQPESQAGVDVAGLLLAFTVDDIDAEYERLLAAGLPITTVIQTEPWGERFFQVTDPNGVVIQLVQWVTEDGQPPA